MLVFSGIEGMAGITLPFSIGLCRGWWTCFKMGFENAHRYSCDLVRKEFKIHEEATWLSLSSVGTVISTNDIGIYSH